MIIELNKNLMKKVKEAFQKNKLTKAVEYLEYRGDSWIVDDKVELEHSRLEKEALPILYEVAKADNNRSLMMLLTTLLNVIKDPVKSKIGSLKALEPGLIEYIKQDAIDGWLYQMNEDDILLPYLVREIEYHAGTARLQESPFVSMSLSANMAENRDGGKKDYRSAILVFRADDIVRKTIPELLSEKNFFKETPELKKNYMEHFELFKKYRPMFGKQFFAEGKGTIDASIYWDRKIVEFPGNEPIKVINDEEIIERTFKEVVDNNFWTECGVEEGFDLYPYHCYIYSFHLSLHEHIWVHVSRMKPYKYDKSLREKLVLPDDHRDLIEVLTMDMEVLLDDIVKGKSGGTSILCVGEPGLGKTLTAEVYSEVIGRPLYRIHSGQLGTGAKAVEENLEIILKRAERWGAVLLLDEADVYIRVRGNDIEHNAVVASFLRTLEYFSGLMFMTTNRANDVDDAIQSRCIATVKYEIPDAEHAKMIWKVLSTQFKIELSSKLIDELVKKFPKITGRDIKELLKLTSKYVSRKEVPYSVEVFRKCAMFRGI
jgi:hypothetical protein